MKPKCKKCRSDPHGFIDEILRFIDKRKDESWEKWQLRVIKETMAKRESKQDTRPRRRADLRIIKGKKEEPKN